VVNTRWRSTCRLKFGAAAVVALVLSIPGQKRLSATLTVLMALVTVNAVVDISRYLIVLEVVRVVPAMAAGALKDRVVVGVDMARGAHAVRVAVARGELRVLRMVERRSGPGSRVVAVLACLREELRLRLMSGICRVVVISRVAAVASGRQRCVVVIDVAITAHARRYQVRTG